MSEPKYHLPPRVASIEGDVRVDLAWLIRGIIEDLATGHIDALCEIRDLVYEMETGDGEHGYDWHRDRVDQMIDPVAKAVGTDMLMTRHAARNLGEALGRITTAAEVA